MLDAEGSGGFDHGSSGPITYKSGSGGGSNQFDSNVADFQNLTETTREYSLSMLKATEGDLDRALEVFFSAAAIDALAAKRATALTPEQLADELETFRTQIQTQATAARRAFWKAYRSAENEKLDEEARKRAREFLVKVEAIKVANRAERAVRDAAERDAELRASQALGQIDKDVLEKIQDEQRKLYGAHFAPLANDATENSDICGICHEDKHACRKMPTCAASCSWRICKPCVVDGRTADFLRNRERCLNCFARVDVRDTFPLAWYA